MPHWTMNMASGNGWGPYLVSHTPVNNLAWSAHTPGQSETLPPLPSLLGLSQASLQAQEPVTCEYLLEGLSFVCLGHKVSRSYRGCFFLASASWFD